jgi:hypothetical protein
MLMKVALQLQRRASEPHEPQAEPSTAEISRVMSAFRAKGWQGGRQKAFGNNEQSATHRSCKKSSTNKMALAKRLDGLLNQLAEFRRNFFQPTNNVLSPLSYRGCLLVKFFDYQRRIEMKLMAQKFIWRLTKDVVFFQAFVGEVFGILRNDYVRLTLNSAGQNMPVIFINEAFESVYQIGRNCDHCLRKRLRHHF